MEDLPEKADIIFVPGNGIRRWQKKQADCTGKELAQKILPSGRYSITVGKFAGVLDKKECYGGTYGTEWEFLRDVLMRNGVPEEMILKEDQATFTYENAIYSRQVTDREQLNIRRRFSAVKPVMQDVR